jgi:transketolase
MTQQELADFKKYANEARRLTIEMIGHVGVGHVGGSCSIIDVLVMLYFRHMRIDGKNPRWPDRDRFVLSKGHAGPALYSVLAMKGYFDRSELATLNQPGTNLPSHCDMNRTVGIDMTAGSLGQGLSAAVGMAIGGQIDWKDFRVYCIIGDGESQEGQIWEAAMLASQYKLDNLIVFTDDNKMQIDGMTDDVVSLKPLDKKWEAFGWHVQSVDGHDYAAIDAAIETAKRVQGQPSMIILNTIKGKGCAFAEGMLTSHNMPVTAEDVKRACAELN